MYELYGRTRLVGQSNVLVLQSGLLCCETSGSAVEGPDTNTHTDIKSMLKTAIIVESPKQLNRRKFSSLASFPA